MEQINSLKGTYPAVCLRCLASRIFTKLQQDDHQQQPQDGGGRRFAQAYLLSKEAPTTHFQNARDVWSVVHWFWYLKDICTGPSDPRENHRS